jgi:hypothetical protein
MGIQVVLTDVSCDALPSFSSPDFSCGGMLISLSDSLPKPLTSLDSFSSVRCTAYSQETESSTI